MGDKIQMLTITFLLENTVADTGEREHFQNSDSFLGPTLDNEHVCSLRGEASITAKSWVMQKCSGKKKTNQCGLNFTSRNILSSFFNPLLADGQYGVRISSCLTSILFLVPVII